MRILRWEVESIRRCQNLACFSSGEPFALDLVRSSIETVGFFNAISTMTNTRPLILELQAEAARIEEDATYSSCGHFEASKPWADVNLWLGIPITIAAAISGITTLQNHKEIASAIAFAVAAGTGLMTFLSPRERQRLHADCGNAYAALRNEARIFRRIECSQNISESELLTRLQILAQRRDELNASSPLVPEKAFRKARRGIEAGEKQHQFDA